MRVVPLLTVSYLLSHARWISIGGLLYFEGDKGNRGGEGEDGERHREKWREKNLQSDLVTEVHSWSQFSKPRVPRFNRTYIKETPGKEQKYYGTVDKDTLSLKRKITAKR